MSSFCDILIGMILADAGIENKEMVKRIFIMVGNKPRLVHLPRWCLKLAILGLHFLPRFLNWSATMADRMERDLVFEHKDATAELGFAPRPFQLEHRDLP